MERLLTRPPSTSIQFTMSTAQTRCRGCKGTFTPHGLSLHIAKTENMRCRTVFSASQSGLALRPVPSAEFSQAQIASTMSQVYPDDYGFTDHEDSDFAAQPSDGESST
jgi:hypothetical protein